jgi:predicted nucleic acid-binding protein
MVMVDADVFFSFLVADELSDRSEKLIYRADSGLLKLRVASEIYDDIITASRSSNTPTEVVVELLSDLRKIPHEVLPTSVEAAVEAMTLYPRYGGSRKLHYFDSFHVATVRLHELPLITTDRFILQNSGDLRIVAMDLRKIWRPVLPGAGPDLLHQPHVVFAAG